MEILYLASGVLSLFFMAILAGKKNKGIPDHMLMVWFLVLFTSMLVFYLITETAAQPWMIELLNASVFLHGPLLFFYTRALTGRLERMRAGSLWHALPFMALFLWTTILNYQGRDFLILLSNILIPFKFVHPLTYILISMWLLRQHRIRIRDVYSNTHDRELKWLSHIFHGSLVLIFLGMITLLIHYFTPAEIPQYGGLYLNIAYSISIIVLGYYGFRQTAIFIPSSPGTESGQKDGKKARDPGAKYLKSGLNEDLKDALYSKLLQHMETEQAFTDPELSIFKLAAQLGTSGNKLSQVINSKTGQNFFEFVNKYRVDMVREEMKGDILQRSTLLGLALDCGFNSKASFNRAFKKHYGETPTEYLKSIQQ